jgi:hypothetical protein
MKRILFLFVLLSAVSSQVFAGSGDLFSYDKDKINAEMTQLTALEDMVSQSQDLTYDDLLAANNPLVADLNMGYDAMLAAMGANMPVLPAFWWGCILGPVGILLVYVIEEDRDQTMSALWGCVIGYGASAVIYTVLWIFVWGNAAL